MHVSVGQGGDRAQGLVGGEEGLAREGVADEGDEVLGQVREVGEGLVADAGPVAESAAEEVAGVGFAFVAACRRGHMHGGVLAFHTGQL